MVCPVVADRNAPEHAGTYDDELALLVVHGILHVLGMDHADADERRAMQAAERELLAAHHGPMAADPWAAIAAEASRRRPPSCHRRTPAPAAPTRHPDGERS